MNLIG